MKQKRWLVSLVGMLMLLAGAMLLGTQPAEAGIFNNSDEVTYKEYWVAHSEFTGGCNPDGSPTNSSASYIEPGPKCTKVLSFNIPDNPVDALKIEVMVDIWRNRDEKVMRYQLNYPTINGAVYQTNDGGEYTRNQFVTTVNKNEIFQGPNTITFTGTKLYQIQDVSIRIYYDDTHPLVPGAGSDVTPPDGALLSITDDSTEYLPNASGETLKVNADKLILKAEASDAKYIEFHAYYDGYDEDRDGDFTDWHNSSRNNWWPGGKAAKANGGTINHIETKTVPGGTGEVSVTWDVKHIVNQQGVKFKVRVVDSAGNVREAAGGSSNEFTLARDYSVFYYMIPNFTDFGLNMFGSAPKTVDYQFQIPNSIDLNLIQEVILVGAYTGKPKFAINASPGFTGGQGVYPAGSEDPSLGIVSMGSNKNALVNGTNTIRYNWTTGQLQFIELPGPMFVYRKGNSGPDTAPPFIISRSPANNSTNVDRRQPIVIHMGENGSGVDPTSILMIVNEQKVTPQVSGSSVDMILTYTPPANEPYPPNTLIPVTIAGCDLLGNCMTSADEFSFTTEPLDETPPVISNIAATVTNSKATITWQTNEAADSKVDHGLTTGYELGAVSNSAAVTSHSIDLTSLQPETIYNYKITSEDQDGNSASTTNLTFKTKPVPGAIKSDDFSACTLNEDIWTYINPLQDATLTMPGQTVNISAPAGTSHDIWSTGANAPRIMQLVTDTDFTVVVKMDSIVTENIQLQGILVQEDADNLLRFTVQRSGDTTSLSLVENKAGKFQSVGALPPIASTPAYFRLTRAATLWTWDYSFDGITWLNAIVYPRALTMTQIGLFAGNGGNKTIPAHTGIFDYFFNMASPIVPEDPTRSLTVNKVGVGDVTKDPDKLTYGCGELIGLEATPAQDWTFVGWSGDLVSTNPVETFQIEDSSVITATFENSLTYTLDVNTEFLGGVDGGTIDIDPAKNEYIYNDVVTLTAEPKAGWTFAGWTGDLIGTSLTETLTIQSNKVVTGTFAREIALETNVVSNPAVGGTGPGGSITRDPDKTVYGYSEPVTLTAVPLGGWIFDGWSGDLNSINLTETVALTVDTAITATFTQETYIVNVTTVGNGSVEISPDQPSYFYDDIVTLTAVPESDLYDFVGWSGDIGGSASPAVFPVQDDMNITATFAIDTTPIEIIDYDIEVFPGGKTARVGWTTDVPGTSVVEYGLTVQYENGQISDETLKTDHVMMLQGLEPEKIYHLQITSVDQYGNSVSTNDITFSTRDRTGIVSDDFAMCGGLDTSVWEWVDPMGDASNESTGSTFNITVPAGSQHDVFSTGNNSARIMQPADDKDFVIQVKFDSRVAEDGAMQGVIIEQDADNFMRFDFYKRNGQVVVYSAAFVDLAPVYSNNRTKIADVDSSLYMRITRSGDTWLHEYSFDGSQWVATSNAPFVHALNVQQVGVFGGNFVVKNNIPAHTTIVDYFFNMESPISPEDMPYTISVNTVGQGAVALTPDQTGYHCGQAVELKAVPANGWVFAGWNGDLSGTLPTRQVVMEDSLLVTGIFVEGGQSAFKAYMPIGIRP